MINQSLALKTDKLNLMTRYLIKPLNKSIATFDYFYIITVAIHKQPLHHFIVTLLMFSLNPFFQFSTSYEFKNPHILFFSIKNAYFVNRYFCKAQKF